MIEFEKHFLNYKIFEIFLQHSFIVYENKYMHRWLTLPRSNFSNSSLKVCEAREIVFLRVVETSSCGGRTNSILPPSTIKLGAGGKLSVVPIVSQYPNIPAFSLNRGWICLQRPVKKFSLQKVWFNLFEIFFCIVNHILWSYSYNIL